MNKHPVIMLVSVPGFDVNGQAVRLARHLGGVAFRTDGTVFCSTHQRDRLPDGLALPVEFLSAAGGLDNDTVHYWSAAAWVFEQLAAWRPPIVLARRTMQVPDFGWLCDIAPRLGWHIEALIWLWEGARAMLLSRRPRGPIVCQFRVRAGDGEPYLDADSVATVVQWALAYTH